MGADIKRENEAFQADYEKIFAKGTWTLEDLTRMKEYKKLIYYNKVICAMDEGEAYPGSEFIPQNGSGARNRNGSGARNRNGMGQYTSGMMGQPYYEGSGNRYYDDQWGDNGSGRRYYDSEKEKAIHKLHSLMENTDDPERKNAYKIALHELEQK